MGHHAVRHALLADPAGEGAGVDPGQRHHAAALQPAVEVAVGPLRAPVGRAGRHVAEDRPPGGGLGPRAELLDVLDVDADVADVGKGEGHDLGHVGGVGQDLLVAGHGGVEADLAQRLADRADAHAFEHRAVGEREHPGGAGGDGSGHGGLQKTCGQTAGS